VLANDSDIDSANLTAVLVTDVDNGDLTLNSDGTFSYTHDGSEAASDSFTYKANDGALDSNTVTVTVTVNPAPPNVTLVTRDSGNDTFDTLDTLAFTFDANVNITAGTLSLLNETAGGTPVDLTGVGFDYHAASMTATWDFTGVAGIDAAFYTGLLDAALITDNLGNQLDGDGDGTAGDDFSHVLLVAQIGDSDLDGDVDLADYNQLATNFDPEGLNSPHEWCDANFDTDLDVDLTDYNLLFTNFSPTGYAGTMPSLYVAPGCDVGSEPLAAASLAVADEVEPGNETSSAMRIDVRANALLPTSPERLPSESPGVDQPHDTQTTITVGRPSRYQAVSAAFAQYESDRQASGAAASSDSSASSLDLSLAEYLVQRENEHVRKLFAK
jgi:VCBS repeat-containing protein